MNKEINIIELTKSHRGVGSTTFTGRPQGGQVRKELKFDIMDSDNRDYQITIPSETISFNPSFFLGLLFPSVKKLGGYEGFSKKYKIVLLEENEELKELLMEDFSECERQARNEYVGKTGLDLL